MRVLKLFVVNYVSQMLRMFTWPFLNSPIKEVAAQYEAQRKRRTYDDEDAGRHCCFLECPLQKGVLRGP